VIPSFAGEVLRRNNDIGQHGEFESAAFPQAVYRFGRKTIATLPVFFSDPMTAAMKALGMT
jgi:hypothetical protein